MLLTDHIDGELDSMSRREIDDHLEGCAACREFGLDARKFAVMPATLKEKIAPPDCLWSGIRSKIESGSPEPRYALGPGFADSVKDLFARLFRIPKPAGAFAVLALLVAALLLTVPSGNKYVGLNEYLGEQVSFLAMLDANESNGATIFDTDIQTGTEYIM